MLGAQVTGSVAGDLGGGPRVHHDLVPGPEQGQVCQPRHVRRPAPPGPARPGRPGPGRGQGRGQVVQGHRRAADRDLPQHRLLAAGVSRSSRPSSTMSALPSSIACSTARSRDRPAARSSALPAGQVLQLDLHVPEAGPATAQQRVGELDQPRMPADRPRQHPPLPRHPGPAARAAARTAAAARPATAAGPGCGPGTGPGPAAGTGT